MTLQTNLTRRVFAFSAAGALAFPATVWAADPEPAIVEIENGKLRGVRANGAIKFKGIPYAADTGGRNRFMAPQPVANWTGVRDALQYGDRAPQARGGNPNAGNIANAVGYSENCCVLNVYTPDLNPNAKRPVMVYFHGGGFSGGSGDGASIEGSNLAVFGDVVVVTTNHRLNAFGYTPLGLVNPDFPDAGNAGLLDLIASLNWVKRNIGAFGGDPGRVTIAGQSGGGSKVTVLQVTPGAQGLFHRSINMSGSSGFGTRPVAEREPAVRDLLRRLNIAPSDAHKLQEVPADQLLAAQDAAIEATKDAGYRAVVDGRHVFHAPFSPEGAVMQASLPGIMSFVADEASAFIRGGPERFQIMESEVKARISSEYGLDAAKTAAVWKGYHNENPSRTPWEVLVAVTSDANFRRIMRTGLDNRVNVRNAPVYFSEFTWKSSAEGGRLGTPHASDIPFAFGNVSTANNPATAAAAMTTSLNEMSIFTSFIRTGNPNNPRIPTWTPYNTTTRPTMVINEQCKLISDYRAADRRIASTLPVHDALRVANGPLMRGLR